MSAQLHVLSLATLFPDDTRPNFGIFVEQSLRALAKQSGVTLTVVAPIAMPPWPLSLHRRYASLRTLPLFEERNGLRVHRPRFTVIPGWGAARNAAAIARAILPIASKMQAMGHLNVIDAQFFHPDGHAAQLVARQLNLPYSVKARGSDISLWGQRADTARQIVSAAEHATGLLAVSSALREDMIALGMPGDRIRVHYTGLDRERFHPIEQAQARVEWGLPSNGKVLLTVGTLMERKGQYLVIDALQNLPPDTHYVLAGQGPDRAVLEQQARSQGLSERVHFLGSVPNARLGSLYAAADAMVLPSVSEGLANAWVEALACGTPLVLSDITPAREIIDAPDAGLIADSTPRAIADAISALLRITPDRQALADRTALRFDWSRNGAELADHLRDCVARQGVG